MIGSRPSSTSGNGLGGLGGDSVSSAYRDDSDLLTDHKRYAAVASDDLDTNKTYLVTMEGSEQYGVPFSYSVNILLHDVYKGFNHCIGRSITVAIKTVKGETRYFNGIVERINFIGMAAHRRYAYRIEMSSWLSLLKYRRNCRIFQDKTSVEIVEEVFRDYRESLIETKILPGLPKRDFCVQYNETDLDFVSRLLEQDGIWYYFEHKKTSHTLVLINHPARNDCSPSTIETNQNSLDVGQFGDDNFSVWHETAALTSSFHVLKDYNHEDPSAQMVARTKVPLVSTGGYPSVEDNDFGLSADVSSPMTHAVTQAGLHASEREDYEYAGRYTNLKDGEFYAKIRAERNASKAYHVEIEGGPRQLHVGETFKSVNPFTITDKDEQPRPTIWWQATRIDIALRGEEHLERFDDSVAVAQEERSFFYRCKVWAIPYQTQFRPELRTPRPIIAGAQTAKVEGDRGSIHTDNLARVKVKFFWDLETHPKFHSSCWIRVAQSMAGSGYGGLVLPRDGQEVIVEFIGGNPDWPIITGAVYNAEKRPPEQILPKSARSIFRSHSINGSRLEYNELRFDDSRRKEEVYLRAQHDYNVEVKWNGTLKVGHDYDVTVKDNATLNVGMKYDVGVDTRYSLAVAPGAAASTPATTKSMEPVGSFFEVCPGKISLILSGPTGRQGLVITPEGVNIVGTTVGLVGEMKVSFLAPLVLSSCEPIPTSDESLAGVLAALQVTPPIT